MTSIEYWHPLLYRAAMRVLYGTEYRSRYRVLAGLIPAGDSVAEFCCGDARLYTHYLRGRGFRYHGYEMNPRFAAWCRRRGVAVDEADVRQAAMAAADTVVMQGSLYQFAPEFDRVFGAMERVCRRRLLLAEPVRNLGSGNSLLARGITRWTNNPGDGRRPFRFTRDSLLALLQGRYNSFTVVQDDPGLRELIVAIPCHAWRAA